MSLSLSISLAASNSDLIYPLSISNLVQFSNANRVTGVTAGAVSSWDDLAPGAARPWTQSTGADQPALNATRFGSRPGIDLVDASNHLVCDSLGSVLGNGNNVASTIALVYKRIGAATNYSYTITTSANDNELIYINEVTAFRRNVAGTSRSVTAGANTANVRVLFVMWDGNQTLETDLDGTVTTGAVAAIGNVTFNRATLGGLRRSTDSLGCNISIYETATYTKVLSVEERANYRAYIASLGLS